VTPASKIRFIPVAHPVLNGNERKYVEECLDTAWISSGGRFLQQFEGEFARFIGLPHALACCNGTAALHLALLGMGVGPEDEIICPTLTYVATANAVRYCGARPVFADAEPRTLNLDPEKIEQLITPRTKGILAVHLYGHPADMDPILDIASRRGLFVIEDTAEAIGARYRGRLAGSLGAVSTFSFFGNKILTTGEGGMVATADEQLARKLALLRGQGMDPERRYWFPVIGYNYRMTNLCAAIGVAQLERIDEHLSARRRVAEWYSQHLAGLCDRLSLPVEEPWAWHAYWMYTVILKDSVPLERDEVTERLLAEGIETRPVFYPMHTLPPYRVPAVSLPVAEMLSRRGFNLPTHGLLTEDDVIFIAERLAASVSA
jgi:perosamine synthetase